MKFALYPAFWALCSGALVLANGPLAHGQEMTGAPTPRVTLLAEAQSNNSQIDASDHAWKAATHVADEVKTLPDPQFTVQSLSVGSPKPLAGISNRDFAYIGFGASQDIPYAGKLRLKGEVANRNADMQQAQTDMLRVSVADQAKIIYLRLAYLNATRAIPGRHDAVLKPLIETGLSKYNLEHGHTGRCSRGRDRAYEDPSRIDHAPRGDGATPRESQSTLASTADFTGHHAGTALRNPGANDG